MKILSQAEIDAMLASLLSDSSILPVTPDKGDAQSKAAGGVAVPARA